MLLVNNPENFIGAKLMYTHINNSSDNKANKNKTEIICAITRIPPKEDESDIFRKSAILDTTRETDLLAGFTRYIDNPELKESDVIIIHSDRGVEYNEAILLQKRQPYTRQIIGDYGKLSPKIIDDELFRKRKSFVVNKPKYRFIHKDLRAEIEIEINKLKGNISYDEYLINLNNEINENPNSVDTLYKLALCERYEKKCVKAGLTLCEAINNGEEIEQKLLAFYLRGIMYLYDFNNYEASQKDLKFIYDIDENFNSHLRYDLAVCYYCLDQYDVAKEHIENYLLNNKNDSRALLLRANIKYKKLFTKVFQGNILPSEKNEILFDYDTVIRLDPNAISYNSRGIFYAFLGDYEKAISDYSKAIEINPEDDLVYSNRGRLVFYVR